MINTILAVDPGAGGGIAIKRGGTPAEAYPMPATEGDVLCLFRELVVDPSDTAVLIEQVGGFIGLDQPASRAFVFGRGFGFLLGCQQTLQVRTELVHPRKWQKSLSLGTASSCVSKTVWKNRLKATAQRLYPHLKPTLATADALLILEYGLRTGVGGRQRGRSQSAGKLIPDNNT